MFRILSLLLIFQRAKSYNTSLVHRYNIIVTKTTMEPTSCINMRLTFHVGKEVEHLNGQFSVYHGGQGLGKANYKPPVSHNKKITVELRLSPCKSYSNIEIRSYHNKNGGFKKDTTSWTAKAFRDCCPDLAPTTTPTSSSPTTLKDGDSTSLAGNFTDTASGVHITEASTIGILVAVVLITLIATALVTILFKKKSDKKKKQNKITVDVNPVYGIYDEGPMYNVVEDSNDYYES